MPSNAMTRAFWTQVRARHPSFATAVVADARITAARRGERHRYRSHVDAAIQVLRLVLVTDAFLAQCCYRAKARCQARAVPLIPRLLHRVAVVTGQISIGDPVVVQPGVFIPHGQVVVDGMVEIASGTTLGPFVTIGLRAGDLQGPTIGNRVTVGTGAKVIGPVTVGPRAHVGANAVVVTDVDAGRSVAGVPARPLG